VKEHDDDAKNSNKYYCVITEDLLLLIFFAKDRKFIEYIQTYKLSDLNSP
jgi:hypothetical protein